jgi:hypothetical protein
LYEPYFDDGRALVIQMEEFSGTLNLTNVNIQEQYGLLSDFIRYEVTSNYKKDLDFFSQGLYQMQIHPMYNVNWTYSMLTAFDLNYVLKDIMF